MSWKHQNGSKVIQILLKTTHNEISAYIYVHVGLHWLQKLVQGIKSNGVDATVISST